MTRLFAVATFVVLAACRGVSPGPVSGTASQSPVATADGDEVAVATVARPTTNRATSTTVADDATSPSSTADTLTSVISSTTVSTLAESTLPIPTLPNPIDTTATGPPCVPTSELTTPTGRGITLRAEGLSVASPLILVIHGYTGTPSGIERVADLTKVANDHGIAVAYPHGTPLDVEGSGWNSGANVFAISGVDDIAALDAMLTAIEATGCVDTDRIVITGESNGGGMTLAALCDPRLDGRFRSAVMVIPAIDDGVLERCQDDVSSPTPLVAVAGRLDRTAPFDGGNGLLPQLDWFGRVATSRGCTAVNDAVTITTTAESYLASGCRACTELIAVADGSHTWPGTPEGTGGLAAGTFDLNRRIVADVLAPEPGCLSRR